MNRRKYLQALAAGGIVPTVSTDKPAGNSEIDTEIQEQMNSNTLPEIAHWQFSPTPGYDREDSLFANPYPYEGIVYVGDMGGRLHALNAETGEQKWRYEGAELPIWSQPAVLQNNVYVGTGDHEDESGRVYAVNRETGEKEWVIDGYSEPIQSEIATADGIIYFSVEQETHAVDSETGDQLWSKQFGRDAVPTISKGIAYLYAGTPVAVDASSGDPIWEADADFSTGGHRPLVTESGVFAGNGYYDLETGEEVFTFDGKLTNESALSADFLFTKDGTKVHVFDTESGDTVRQIDVSGDVRSMLYSDETLYVGTAQTESGGGQGESGGVLHAIDPQTGEHLWAASAINAELRLSPHTDSGLLFAAGTTGQLFAIKSGVNPFSETTNTTLAESAAADRDVPLVPGLLAVGGIGVYLGYRKFRSGTGEQ
jgi:outer membrane protein assembly factor BamB